jgi:hypothetical protein
LGLEILRELRAKIEYPWAAMAEWLILLLLVPAIVVPVVLFVGFAGCDITWGLGRFEQKDTIVDAVGISFDTITVSWGGPSTTARFRRTNIDNIGFERSDSTFDDSGLEPTNSAQNLVYEYQVQDTSADPNEPSAWSPPKAGKTFESTFDGMLKQDDQHDSSGWEGRTLVQRIEPARLSKSSNQIQILVQASSSGASIDSIFISQADPGSTANPWDPFTDLTPVPLPQKPFPVAAGKPVPLPPVSYTLDRTIPLLIAVDFSWPAPSGVKYSDPVPSMTQAALYYFPYHDLGVPPEASKPKPRSADYTLVPDGDPSLSNVGFIASIFVFVG